jgi:hypothetical protein
MINAERQQQLRTGRKYSDGADGRRVMTCSVVQWGRLGSGCAQMVDPSLRTLRAPRQREGCVRGRHAEAIGSQ